MHHIKPNIIKQNGKQKPGKGFSLNEIKQAGISRQKAKQMGLPVDRRRKSAHVDNVENIRAHAKPKS